MLQNCRSGPLKHPKIWLRYNYLDILSQAGRKGLEYAAKKDICVIIMEPLQGGNLGKTPLVGH